MQQIKLDDKFDLAVDGNEAWVIDYSQGLHAPKHGARHIFSFSPATVTKVEPISPNEAIIYYSADDQTRIAVAQISETFITFTDPDAPKLSLSHKNYSAA